MLNCLRFLPGYLAAFGQQMRRDDRGVTAVEYGLILALIAGLIVVGLLVLGPALGTLFTNSGNCVAGPSAANCPNGT
jgi:pilus assembly protein Flp/PilA